VASTQATPNTGDERRRGERRRVDVGPPAGVNDRRVDERRATPYRPGLKMECANCGGSDSVVTNSRPTSTKEAIRRRRECVSCGTRFTTYERNDGALEQRIDELERQLAALQPQVAE